MINKYFSKVLIISSIIVAVGLITGVYVFASYNIETAKKLHYPIKELGSCVSFEECKIYCNKDENIPTCIRFDIKNNLLTQSEAADAEKMLSLMDTFGLPGKCAGNLECFAYCESAAHFDECFDYAKRHDLIPAGWSTDNMKRLVQLHKQGLRFPGNCQDKTECEAYCADDNHSDECVSFLEEAGFITSKEADLARKFKGKSPGDCAKGTTSFAEGQKSCNTFCNDPTNQPVCFRFMEEAGIMTAEEATQAGAISDFQACIPSAPEKIKQCFIDNLGLEMFDAMSHGVLPFDEDIEGMMNKIRGARKCVNRYANQSLETLTNNPDALSCIDSELGKDYLEKAKRGEVKCGDAAESQKKITSCIETAISTKLNRCFALACTEAITCLQSLQGSSNEESTKGKLDPALEQKLNDKLAECSIPQQGDQGQGSQQQPQIPSGDSSSSQQQNPQDYCSSFASVPNCSYVSSPDSDNYKYCKQCFPDK